MGHFSNLFGAAAIAGNFITYAQAEETPQGIITDVNGAVRVQLHDLPTDPIPNFFGKHEELPRNPGQRLAVPQVDKDGKPADTIGKVDERIMVTHTMRDYDPVLQMMDSQGNAFCTATISEIEGYDLKETGTIITTAAHCLHMPDSPEGYYTFRKPEDLFFKGSFVDEKGRYQEYSWRADEIWINPLFIENDLADMEYLRQNGKPKDLDLEGDSALIYSKLPTPEEITPAVVYPVTMADAVNILNTLDEMYYQGKSTIVTVSGHSSDKPYLTTHERAEIVWGDYDGLGSLADIVPGASGGPVFMASLEYPVVKDSEGRPILLAVNSTRDLNDEEGETARHTYYNTDTLATVPFLTPVGQEADEICYQTGEVIVDDLNIRVAPDVNYQTLAAGAGQTSSQLSSGVLFTVHDMTRNSLGQEWALVTTELGRTGYISANPDYVRVEPESCIKFKL